MIGLKMFTFTATIVQFAPIRTNCLNEGLLKTEREPHGITKMSHGRMRALDTAESNAITTQWRDCGTVNW